MNKNLQLTYFQTKQKETNNICFINHKMKIDCMGQGILVYNAILGNLNIT